MNVRAGSKDHKRREKWGILERSSMSVDSTCTSCEAWIVGNPVSRTERSEDLLVGGRSVWDEVLGDWGATVSRPAPMRIVR